MKGVQAAMRWVAGEGEGEVAVAAEGDLRGIGVNAVPVGGLRRGLLGGVRAVR